MKGREKMEKARVQLLLDHPFFGYLGSYLDLELREDLENPVGTDYEKLYFNPEIVNRTSVTELKASIAHGILHTALGHQWRRGERSEEFWNSATDTAVNWILKESGFKLPSTSKPPSRFKNKSAEEIYSELVEIREEKPGRSGEKLEKSGEGDKKKSGGMKKKTEEMEKDSQGQNPLDDHKVWKEARKDLDLEKDEVNEEWKRRAAESTAFARRDGRIPEALERMVEEILEPKVDWRGVLRRYILRHAREDYDWMKPDRRLLQHGIYYPSPRSERLDLAVAVDTSGSIRKDVLKKFLSEVEGILQSADSYHAQLLACDAKVHSDMSIGEEQGLDVEKAVKEFSKSLKGRGGTRFSPVFKALDEETIQVLIYLTDGRCTENLEKPRYDVIWALPEEGTTKHLDFGEVVKLERGKKRPER